ncbi:class I SAM-dependent methyltransferase [Bosea sp. AAP35]|uniref:class I SAM-dependent methyltransferase n=1 Tax=Bosea sp. AAP35 TaxID=1523417 RepID=UPI0006B8B1CD|nr:class I SAM-dependent methyltransferase [Bosea sp. AAP35]
MASRAFTSLLQAIEKGAFPRTRKWLWRGLYNGLSRHWRDDDWRFMNYGFVDQAAAFPLHSDDEPDRPFIGLYAQAVAGLPITDAQVVEIGSGRGGGARYIARYHNPAWVVGIDYSATTVGRARGLNDDAVGLSFEIGDAERLPLETASCDIVVNIESSHCYSDVPAFAREVARVLKPGGWFTFADMRGKAAIADLRRQLMVPGLQLRSERDLSAGVVAALDAAEHRKRARLGQVRFGRAFIAEFSGSQGSTLYRELTEGGVIYLAQRYQKVADPLQEPSST